MTKLIVVGLLAAAAAFFPLAAAESTTALRDLHDARFDAAEAALGSANGADSRPENLFSRAFVTYWRLIYDPANLDLRRRLEKQLSTVIARADATRDEDPSAALWAGNARLLLAQLRVIEKKSLGAAMEAKRARKELLAVDAQGPAGDEALFGLGTYNYMADRVPSFVKGLRALLFIPAGDRELGLRQLERAAKDSRWFSVEARLLLVTIAANRHERRYRDALAQAARARKESPDSLVVAHAVAKLRLSLGHWDEAEQVIDPALAKAHALSGVDPIVVAVLELQRARLDYARFRPDLAEPRAAALLEARGLPADLRENASRLVAAPEANETLIQGRAALVAGRSAEALALLEKAESSGQVPEVWLGFCRLLAGQAADLQGQRAKAIAFYKRAEATPGFFARDAAIDYQSRPFEAAAR